MSQEIRNLRSHRHKLNCQGKVKASKLIKSWVDLGLLAVANPAAAKKNRRYVRPGKPLELSLFSEKPGNQEFSSIY
jgi:hypothetical protein